MPIQKRGNSWRVRVNYRGRRFETTVRGTKEQARQVEAAMLKRAASDRLAHQTGSSLDRTWADAMIQYTGPQEGNLKYSLHLSDTPLEGMGLAATEWRDRMVREGYSPCTINRRLAAIRRVLRLAWQDWDWLREPQHQKIRLLSEKGTERHYYLEPEQVQDICRHVTPEAAMVIQLAAMTGLRKSEIWRLEEGDYRQGVLLVRKAKSGKPRSVPVPAVLALTVPVPITYARFRKQWDAARIKAGLPHIRFHDLRHTYASWLAGNPEIPMTMIRDLMGHSSMQMTGRYSHIRDGANTKAAEIVGQKWAKVSGGETP